MVNPGVPLSDVPSRSPGASAHVTSTPRVLALPLQPLDQPVEVRMAWCPTPLWLAPDEPAADALVAHGIPRGQTWTLAELQFLLALPGITTASARQLALLKLEIDGVLSDVLPGPDPADHGSVPPHDPSPLPDDWLPGLEPPSAPPTPRRTPPRPFAPLTALKQGPYAAPRRLGSK
jgi:hypothetical protein